MIPRQSPLGNIPHRVGESVQSAEKLNGRPLHERARGYDDLGVILPGMAHGTGLQ